MTYDRYVAQQLLIEILFKRDVLQEKAVEVTLIIIRETT
jgi:hypothetical protein